MKKIIIILLVAISINASSQQPQQPTVADSVYLFSTKDMLDLKKFIGDNTSGTQFEPIANAINQFIYLRQQEYLAAKTKPAPVPEKKQTPKSK